jgi:putative FmdB family regulatory protein
MPTYEYRCKACGEDLEVVQSFTDDALTVCPACGGELRKVFGNIGITFKGSGFYRTDSRTNGRKKADAKPSESKAESSGDSSKGESKSTDTKTSDTKTSDKTSSTSVSNAAKSA